ncbi:hypothetical protein BC6307_02090 [Sutcliffiella cohnii]|uniref:Activator of Hsp90 ATPase homologue 1/2-like C-terminal domain-containing protein n=1 Tax=Sutcliffiella cohnii TaxID=33932 RepID=A0A223KLB2_9BACI|nr:SRPBCC domain-containing protein [Sutcliffiella cohnii]AST90154.1 hypothetical protein BC6307_02090 [Sutcliffiella cohnii]
MQKIQDIVKTAIFDAPIQKVWEKVSSAEGISTWFMPNDFEPRVGHVFHIQSPFGPSPCKVIEVEEPNKISFSWDTDGWIVTFLLKEVEEKTEFTLIHSGWKTADTVITKPNEDSAVIRNRMNNGWEDIVHAKLRKVVEG